MESSFSHITGDPNIDTVYLSEGPTTQYRQKGNFYFFSTLVFDYGFQNDEWNYHKAAHGKGTPDALGGRLKRLADTHVRHGNDINSAKAFLDALATQTKLPLRLIKDIKLDKIVNFKALKPIPGTLKLHQISTDGPRHLRYRDESCFCHEDRLCNGHLFRSFT